jgi:hypothetical protein
MNPAAVFAVILCGLIMGGGVDPNLSPLLIVGGLAILFMI